jgi:hypothetical protein
MQFIGSVQEKQKQQNHQLNRKYMKRVDADITRRHTFRTLEVLAIIAFLLFLVLAPGGFQIHHLVYRHLLPFLTQH